MTISDVRSTMDAVATQEALTTSCVVQWWQTSAIVRLHGPEAVSFLEGFCTQAVARIPTGRAAFGLVLDGKAKIVAPIRILPYDLDGESGLLLETRSDCVEPLVSHLKRFKLRAKVDIHHDKSIGIIALVGPGALDVDETISPDVAIWTVNGVDALPERIFVGPASAIHSQVEALIERFGAADPDTLDAARIDAGVPWLASYEPGRMPAEVGAMRDAVSLDKGCYLGQEPVARLHYRGKANRALRHVDLSTDIKDRLRFHAPDDAPQSPKVRAEVVAWAKRPDSSWTGLAIVRREMNLGDELVAAEAPEIRMIIGKTVGAV